MKLVYNVYICVQNTFTVAFQISKTGIDNIQND